MAKLSLKEEEFLALVRGGDIKKIKEYIIKCDEEGYDILNNFPPNSSTPKIVSQIIRLRHMAPLYLRFLVGR